MFSSRSAVILAGIGMAVGTGNLWRFPRIASQNGGAAFLIPWMLFLFLWSLPLLIAEFGIGRGTRRGPVGAFVGLLGRRYAWMGGFVAATTIMIMFYYSVVTGWTLKYFVATLESGFLDDPAAYWASYSTSIWQPILFHVVAVTVAACVVARGLLGGIERANRLLIPTLFGLLVLAAGRAATLDGAESGFRFLFEADLAFLGNYRTWLEALTQSAWSTGAGWGLILAYAVYVDRREDVVVNATAIGIGNNCASLLAAIAIVPTAFAVLSPDLAEEALAAGNTGLTFIWIPQLFSQIPLGEIFLPLFFLALFCAALSSLIAMIEMSTRVLMDRGLQRLPAVSLMAGATIVCGIPSAVSLAIFENQDWVWGLALMISGLFISIATTRYGPRRLRDELINIGKGNVRVGRLYGWVLTYLVPFEFLVMFGWWMYQAATVYDPEDWWNPIRVYSVGTCLLQWGIVLGLLWAFNRRLVVSES